MAVNLSSSSPPGHPSPYLLGHSRRLCPNPQMEPQQVPPPAITLRPPASPCPGPVWGRVPCPSQMLSPHQTVVECFEDVQLSLLPRPQAPHWPCWAGVGTGGAPRKEHRHGISVPYPRAPVTCRVCLLGIPQLFLLAASPATSLLFNFHQIL